MGEIVTRLELENAADREIARLGLAAKGRQLAGDGRFLAAQVILADVD